MEELLISVPLEVRNGQQEKEGDEDKEPIGQKENEEDLLKLKQNMIRELQGLGVQTHGTSTTLNQMFDNIVETTIMKTREVLRKHKELASQKEIEHEQSKNRLKEKMEIYTREKKGLRAKIKHLEERAVANKRWIEEIEEINKELIVKIENLEKKGERK